MIRDSIFDNQQHILHNKALSWEIFLQLLNMITLSDCMIEWYVFKVELNFFKKLDIDNQKHFQSIFVIIFSYEYSCMMYAERLPLIFLGLTVSNVHKKF
jgi:hypothetical protein